MKLMDIVKLIAVVIGAGVLAQFVGYGASAGILGGVALIGLGLSKYGQKMGIKKDMHKGAIVLIGALLIFGVPILTNPYNQAVGGVSKLLPVSSDISGNTDTATTGSTGSIGSGSTSGSGQTIVTTTSTLTVNAESLFNKTRDALNPSGLISLDGTSYKTLSFTTGSASQASLDPFATIPRIAVGTDGSFYWEVLDNFQLKGSLSPTVTMHIVRVASSTATNLYGTTYTDLTDGKNNVTVGAGGNQKGFLRFEVTSSFTALRHPIIAVEYNTSAVSSVDMSLGTATCPSRVITTSSNPVNSLNGIQQCYDTGSDWFASSDSKQGVANTVYGFKDFAYTVNYVTGVNPSDAGAGGNNVVFYIVDQDKFYRSSDSSKLFATDPDTGNTNLGYTTQPHTYLGVA